MKKKEKDYVERHLGNDSITIIVFSCALTTEEYSNKPVQENIDRRLG